MAWIIGLFNAILILFCAGYVTGKEIERKRLEKEIKRGITIVENKLYFCHAPYIAATVHVRNATKDEIDEHMQRL